MVSTVVYLNINFLAFSTTSSNRIFGEFISSFLEFSRISPSWMVHAFGAGNWSIYIELFMKLEKGKGNWFGKSRIRGKIYNAWLRRGNDFWFELENLGFEKSVFHCSVNIGGSTK